MFIHMRLSCLRTPVRADNVRLRSNSLNSLPLLWREGFSPDRSELDVAAMMIDGIIFAECCCVVALAITSDATKVPVGLWEGDTENTTVVRDLLADLV
jgi:hypothetical protein